jgi:hypothetical protein
MLKTTSDFNMHEKDDFINYDGDFERFAASTGSDPKSAIPLH